MDNLYDTDFNLWIEKQRTFLENKDFENLDLDNLIEELESMGKSDYNALESHLEILLSHLLKYSYQTFVLKDPWVEKYVVRSWYPSIRNARREIEKGLKIRPSMKSRLKNDMDIIYIASKKEAIKGMNDYSRSDSQKLNDKSFPDQCPWSIDRIMLEDWLPEEKI